MPQRQQRGAQRSVHDARRPSVAHAPPDASQGWGRSLEWRPSCRSARRRLQSCRRQRIRRRCRWEQRASRRRCTCRRAACRCHLRRWVQSSRVEMAPRVGWRGAPLAAVEGPPGGWEVPPPAEEAVPVAVAALPLAAVEAPPLARAPPPSAPAQLGRRLVAQASLAQPAAAAAPVAPAGLRSRPLTSRRSRRRRCRRRSRSGQRASRRHCTCHRAACRCRLMMRSWNMDQQAACHVEKVY